MYIYSRNLLPECFDNLFISSNQVHNHNTTGAAGYAATHACRTNIKQFTILHAGSAENMELSSFINNRNKYHFFFQTKISKIFY